MFLNTQLHTIRVVALPSQKLPVFTTGSLDLVQRGLLRGVKHIPGTGCLEESRKLFCVSSTLPRVLYLFWWSEELAGSWVSFPALLVLIRRGLRKKPPLSHSQPSGRSFVDLDWAPLDSRELSVLTALPPFASPREQVFSQQILEPTMCSPLRLMSQKH